ncbi:MAG: c-type cytochrome [Oceanicaulis sp.]
MRFALPALCAAALAACSADPTHDDAEIEGTEREPAMEAVPGEQEATARSAPEPISREGDRDDTRAAAAENAPGAQAVLARLGAPYTRADLSNGERLWRRCRSCHTIAPGAPHRVGPNLHGVFTRAVGTADGFRYSDALSEAEFQWSPARLDDWLADPRGFLPGNRMSFAGLDQAQDRTDLIAWLAVDSAR